MTRFLPRVLGDPECGGLNEETARLFAYHQATKHTYHSVRANAHFLDWRNQPNPFRTYEGAPLIALPPEPEFPSAGTFATMAALAEQGRVIGASQSEPEEPVQLDVNWLSRLLQALDGGQHLEKSAQGRRTLQPARKPLVGESSSDGSLPGGDRVRRNQRRPLPLSCGPARPRTARAGGLVIAARRRPGNALGGGVAVDRGADLDFLARGLEIPRPRLPLLLSRFGTRDDELASGSAPRWGCPAACWVTSATSI